MKYFLQICLWLWLLFFYFPSWSQTNDDPCKAVMLGANETCVNGNNTAATATPGIPDPSCTLFSPENDVWYSFTLTTVSDVLLTTSAGTMTDGVMQIFSASTCNGFFKEVGCDDDSNGKMPQISLQSLPTGRYFVRLYSINVEGTFQICLHTYPPLTSDFEVCNNDLVNIESTLVTYTGNASRNAKYYWSFDRGIASPGIGQGPHLVNWASHGSKKITLIVEENGILSKASSHELRVNSVAIPPSASFLIKDSTYCKGQTVNIPIQLTGRGPWTVRYQEEGGSGSISKTLSVGASSSCNPFVYGLVLQPAVTTTYTLLGVKDARFEEQRINKAITATISQTPVPTASFTVSKTTVALDQPAVVTYTGNADASAHYKWDFDGGMAVPGVGKGPHTVKWATPGTKKIALALRQGSCTAAGSQSLTVVNAAVSNDEPCGAVEWKTGGSCDYQVITNEGATASENISAPTCSDKQSIKDIWYKFTLTNISEVIATTKAGTLDDASMQILSAGACNGQYSEVGCDDNSIGYMPTVSLSGLAPGTYYIRIWGNQGKSGNLSLCLKTSPVPSPTAKFVQSTVTVCPGDTAQVLTSLTGSGPWVVYFKRQVNGKVTSDSLKIGNGLSKTPFVYPIRVLVPATTVLSLTGVKDVYSGIKPATGSVTLALVSRPAAIFKLSAVTLEVNKTLTATYQGNVTSKAVVFWEFDGGIPATASTIGPHTVKWATPGKKKIRLTVTAGNCGASTEQMVTVNGSNPYDAPCNAPLVPISASCRESNPIYSIDKATISTNVPNPSCGIRPQGDVWMRFSVTAISNLTIAASSGSIQDAAMQVFAAQSCTGPFTEMGCASGAGTSRMPQVELKDVAVGTYFIRLWSASNNPGTFGICVRNTEEAYPPSIRIASPGSTICSGELTGLKMIAVGKGPWILSYLEKAGNTAVARTTTFGNRFSTSPFSYTLAVSPKQTTTYRLVSILDLNFPKGQPAQDSVTITVGATGTPQATFEIAGDSVLIPHQATTIRYVGEANASPGDKFQWDFNGGVASPGTGVGPHTVNWSTFGKKKVTLKVFRGNCVSAEFSRQIEVNQNNDEPCNAIELPVSPVGTQKSSLYSNTGATNSAQIPYCQSTTANDVWFVFQNDTLRKAMVSVLPGTLKNPIVQVMEATSCAGPLRSIACHSAGSDGQTVVLDSLKAGKYFIRVWGLNEKQGSFGIVITPPKLPRAQFLSSSFTMCQEGSTELPIQLEGSGPWTLLYSESQDTSSTTRGLMLGDADSPSPFVYKLKLSPAKTTTYTLVGLEDRNYSYLPLQTGNREAIVRVTSPVASSNFSLSKNNITTGEIITLTFTGKSSSQAKFDWDLDGGKIISGTVKGPFTVKWSYPGTMTVRLTVSDEGCSSTTAQTIIVTGTNLQDQICGAVALPINAICSPHSYQEFNSTGATQSLSGGCFTGIQNDIYFSIKIEKPQAVVITTETGTMQDGIMQFLTASSCSASSFGQPYLCDDNSAQGSMPRITTPVLAVGTYFLSVCGKNGEVGSFGICVSSVAPPDASFATKDTSFCSGQSANIPVRLTGIGPWILRYNENGDAKTITLGSSKLTGPVVVSLPAKAPAKYTLTGVSDGLYAASQPLSKSLTTSLLSFDPKFKLSKSQAATGETIVLTFTGAAATGSIFRWDLDGGIITAGSGAGPLSVKWLTSGSRTVGLNIQKNNCQSALYSQSITISGANLLDEPCNAIALAVNANCTFSEYSTKGATSSKGIIPPVCSDNSVTINDVWLKFTITSESDVEIATQDRGLSDGVMQLLKGSSCGSTWTEVGCNDDYQDDVMPTIRANSLAPGNYFVRFWGFNGEEGSFGICVKASPPQRPFARFLQSAVNSACVDETVNLPIELTGKGPWNLTYAGKEGGTSTIKVGAGLKGPYIYLLPVKLKASSYYLLKWVNDAAFSANRFLQDTAFISVTPLPTAGITVPVGGTLLCQGQTVKLQANEGDGLSYQWQRNGADIAGATTSAYLASEAGNYKVVVVNTCQQTAQSVVVVLSAPAPPTASIATPPGGLLTCPEQPLKLQANEGDGLSYQWQRNGADIAGATASAYVASEAGNYTVVVANACQQTAPSAVVVLSAPTPPTASIATPPGSLLACPEQPLKLQANEGAGFGYQWQLDGTGILGATSSAYEAAQAGNYTVIVTNACKQTAKSAVVTLIMAAVPTATIATPSGTILGCQGQMVKLQANEGAGFGYQWQLDGTDILGATSSAYEAAQAGNYTVIVTNACKQTAKRSITVTALPFEVSILAEGNVLRASAGNEFQWYLNNGLLPNANQATLPATTAGSYRVTAKDRSGCVSNSPPFNFILTALAPALQEQVTINPNPTSGIVQIKLESTSALPLELEVFDTYGRMVFSKKVEKATVTDLAFDLGDLSNGIYFLTIRKNNRLIGLSKLIMLK